MTDIPFMIITPILVMFFLGNYIDNKMGNKFPIFTVIGFVFGMITGFWSVYKKYGK